MQTTRRFLVGSLLLVSAGAFAEIETIGNPEQGQTTMIDTQLLAREWIELREESPEGRVLFRPKEYKIPPARGRRRLDLREPGRAVAKLPGPNDRLDGKEGTWSVSGSDLILSAPGWKGTFRVEELTEDKLILRPR